MFDDRVYSDEIPPHVTKVLSEEVYVGEGSFEGWVIDEHQTKLKEIVLDGNAFKRADDANTLRITF